MEDYEVPAINAMVKQSPYIGDENLNLQLILSNEKTIVV